MLKACANEDPTFYLKSKHWQICEYHDWYKFSNSSDMFCKFDNLYEQNMFSCGKPMPKCLSLKKSLFNIWHVCVYFKIIFHGESKQHFYEVKLLRWYLRNVLNLFCVCGKCLQYILTSFFLFENCLLSIQTWWRGGNYKHTPLPLVG